MSEQQISQQAESASPEAPTTPQEIKEANNQNRKSATRPGWIAGVCALVFVGGLVAFMANF